MHEAIDIFLQNHPVIAIFCMGGFIGLLEGHKNA